MVKRGQHEYSTAAIASVGPRPPLHATLKPPHWLNAHSVDVPIADGKEERHLSSSSPQNLIKALDILKQGAVGRGLITEASSAYGDQYCKADCLLNQFTCRRSFALGISRIHNFLERLYVKRQRWKLSRYFARWISSCPRPMLDLTFSVPLLERMNRRRLLQRVLHAWRMTCRPIYMEDEDLVRRRKGRRLVALLLKKYFKSLRYAIARWLQLVDDYYVSRRLAQRTFNQWRIAASEIAYRRTYLIPPVALAVHKWWLLRCTFDEWLNGWLRRRRLHALLRILMLRRGLRGWIEAFEIAQRRRARLRKCFTTWEALVSALLRWARANRQRRLLVRAYGAWKSVCTDKRLLRRMFTIWRRWKEMLRAATLLRMMRGGRGLMLTAWRRWLEYPRRPIIETVPNAAPALVRQKPHAITCRCIRCKHRYGHAGANRQRNRAAPDYSGVVVSESLCSVEEHLDLRLRQARVQLQTTLNKTKKSYRQAYSVQTGNAKQAVDGRLALLKGPQPWRCSVVYAA